MKKLVVSILALSLSIVSSANAQVDVDQLVEIQENYVSGIYKVAKSRGPKGWSTFMVDHAESAFDDDYHLGAYDDMEESLYESFQECLDNHFSKQYTNGEVVESVAFDHAIFQEKEISSKMNSVKKSASSSSLAYTVVVSADLLWEVNEVEFTVNGNEVEVESVSCNIVGAVSQEYLYANPKKMGFEFSTPNGTDEDALLAANALNSAAIENVLIGHTNDYGEFVMNGSVAQ